VWAVTAFVAHEIAFVIGGAQEFAEPPIDTNDPLQLRWIVWRSAWDNKYVLNIQIFSGMLAAGNHVGHWQRQARLIAA